MTTRHLFADMNQVNIWISKNIGPKDTYRSVNKLDGTILLIVSKFKDRDPYARTFYR